MAIYTEPLIITAMFVSGVAQVDPMEDDMVCLSWYLDLPPVATEDGTTHELRLVEKIIMPRSAIPELQAMLARVGSLDSVQRAKGLLTAH